MYETKKTNQSHLTYSYRVEETTFEDTSHLKVVVPFTVDDSVLDRDQGIEDLHSK